MLLLQNLLQTLRALRTQGWQVAVSTLGLAISIMCLTYSVNWLWSDTHYDAFRPNSEELYILQQRDSADTWHSSHFPHPEAETLVQLLRQRGDSVGIYRAKDPRRKLHLTQVERTDTAATPHQYSFMSISVEALHTLGVEALHGNMEQALRDNQLVVTDLVAREMFGHTNVVGEILMEPRDQRRSVIGAVIEANRGKTVFPYDVVTTLVINDDWERDNYNARNFRLVLRSKNIDATLRALDGIKMSDGNVHYYAVEPIGTFVHLPARILRSSYSEHDLALVRELFYQVAFVGISLLLLLSALANLIAVNTSICLSRTREYALRRSLGGSTWQNAQWLLTGIVPTLLLAIMLAAVAHEWAVKMQWAEVDTYWVNRIFWLCVSAAVVGSLLGMLYPIAKMHRIYKRSFAGSGSMGRSHGWLVAVQCVACAFLLFLAWGMNLQLRSMINVDTGMDTRNLLRLHTGWAAPDGVEEAYNFEHLFYTLPEEFKKQRGAGIVDAVAVPADIFNRNTGHGAIVVEQHLLPEINKVLENLDAEKWEELQKYFIKADYIEMPYGVQRFFRLRTTNGVQMREMSEMEPQMQVYANDLYLQQTDRNKRYCLLGINENTNSMMDGRKPKHWEEKEILLLDEANLNMTDFRKKRKPTIYVGVPDGHECCNVERDAVYIRYADGRRDDAEAAVRKILADMDVPDGRYMLTTFEEHVTKSYKEDLFYASLVTWLTAFSFLITLAGVFSTLLYTLRLQRRSMAIRRVMGAEFRDVLYGTLRPYVIYAVLGAAIAFAPAALLMNKWMSFFSYNNAPGLGLMLCVLLMMLTVITFIVLWQVNKSMNEKPVDVLRPEA